MRIVNLTKQKIVKSHIQRKTFITKTNIDSFIRPEWHREFRGTHVAHIRCGILKGIHPSESITINEQKIRTARVKRIINGNHRMEAIRQIIEKYPQFQIEMTFNVYYNLTKEEEIDAYTIINKVMKETAIDKLKANLQGSDIYCLIENSFPCRVLYRPVSAGDRNAITINSLLTPYVYRNNTRITGPMTTKYDEIKEYDETDYARMKKFILAFKDMFGEPSRDNMYSTYNVLCVLAKLYYTLVGTDLTEADYKKKITKIARQHASDFIIYSKGIHRQTELYLFIIRKMSGGRRLYNVFEATKEYMNNK